MIASISPDSALRASGRFIVTTRTWSFELHEGVRLVVSVGARFRSWGPMLVRNKNVF